MTSKWYETAYRRNVVDMHITDFDERFLADFDAKQYVEMLARSQAQSAVVYAHSHVGLCYFPSKVCPVHRGPKSPRILGDVIEECHRRGIHVVVYYSVTHDRMAYQNNPDWRMVDAGGGEYTAHHRQGFCCPNAPYRDYVAAIVTELCEQFQFEGMRFDMTFWPRVCFCRHCQRRFAEEVGGELPRVINWEDPRWVGFQRKREEWLVDFAALQTATVRRLKPEASVEHQSAVYHANWRFGVTHALAPENDTLQGDFYGDALQGSFVRKLFYNLTPNRPAAFETSIAEDLTNPTALKPVELLKAKASAALADGCAFVFIDSIDPEGTLNPAVYERMGQVFSETKAYEPYLGGNLVQDVAVYLSTESKCDFADNGKPVEGPGLSWHTPHVDAAVSAYKTLLDNHIPVGVITGRSLGDLARHKIVILPNVLMMSPEEAEALREYVRTGGALYASRYTSLITADGARQPDFLLADVFGVSYRGETKEIFTYIAPAAGAEELFAGYTRKHPPGQLASQMVVAARPGARVLGTTVLPYTDPVDWEHYASIHNNPPGVETGNPAAVLNHFGAGKALYLTGDLESADLHRPVFMNLLRLLGDRFSFEADAPRCVEVTLFHQEDRRRYLLCLVNFQKELPNVPVSGVRVRIRLDGRSPRRLLLLPEQRAVDYALKNGVVEFTAPQLETLLMFALDYE